MDEYGSWTMLHLLYVDDESDLLGIAKVFLDKPGECSVDICLSAEEALSMGALDRYDAVISDYQMPDMDGIRFLQEIRSRYGDLPFILFTGRGREEIVIQAFNEGADFYIQKGGAPRAQFAELAHKVRVAVERRRTSERLRETTQYLENLINYANSPIIVWDGTCTIRRFNHAFALLAGVPPEEAVGQPIGILFDEKTRESAMDLIRETTRGSQWKTVLIPIQHSSGEIRLVLWNSATITDPSGNIVAVIAQGSDITGQKQAEEEVMKKEDLYRTILETTMDGFWLADTNGRCLDVNETYCRMTGYAREEILSMSINDFDGLESPEITRSRVERIISSGGDIFVSRHRRKDGSLFDVEVRAQYQSVAGGRLVVFIRDITGHLQTLTALSENETRYRGLVDSCPDMISSVAPDGTILTMNHGSLKILGYPPDEMIGHNIREFYTPESLKKAEWEIRRKMDGSIKPSKYIVNGIAKDGRVVTCEVHSSLLTRAGTPPVITGFLRDISHEREKEGLVKEVEERCRMQEKALRLYQEIRHAANQEPHVTAFLLKSLIGVLRHLDFDAGGVYLTSPGTDTAKVVCSRNIPGDFLEKIETVPIRDPPYDGLFIRGESLIMEEYDRTFPEHSTLSSLKTVISVPLISRSAVIGALTLGNTRKKSVSDAEKTLVADVGRQIGVMTDALVRSAPEDP